MMGLLAKTFLAVLVVAATIGAGFSLDWPSKRLDPGQRQTLPGSPATAEATEAVLGPATVWIGLKNSDDQGTQFDLRVEVYKNGSLIATGTKLCITGVTRNPDKATSVQVPIQALTDPTVSAGDRLSLKVLARIGTLPDGAKCSGPGGSHTSATGLRLYFDAAGRASALASRLLYDAPITYFLHVNASSYLLTHVRPIDQVAPFKDSSSLAFSGGNAWKEIGTWGFDLGVIDPTQPAEIRLTTTPTQPTSFMQTALTIDTYDPQGISQFSVFTTGLPRNIGELVNVNWGGLAPNKHGTVTYDLAKLFPPAELGLDVNELSELQIGVKIENVAGQTSRATKTLRFR